MSKNVVVKNKDLRWEVCSYIARISGEIYTDEFSHLTCGSKFENNSR